MKTCGAVPRHPASFDKHRLRHPLSLAFVGTAMIFLTSSLHAESSGRALSPTSIYWKLFNIRVIAKGSVATSGNGSMESYLVTVSRRRDRAQAVARLVYYHPSYETGILDQRIRSGQVLRLRLSAENYCAMAASDFLVREIFDADELSKALQPNDQRQLPCFLVRH
jgi:hypothetical protein